MTDRAVLPEEGSFVGFTFRDRITSGSHPRACKHSERNEQRKY
jgi:hypothetical protein